METIQEAFLKQSPDVDDLAEIMPAVFTKLPNQVIILDGLGECEKQERTIVVSALRKVMHSSQSNVNIFIAMVADQQSALHETLSPQ